MIDRTSRWVEAAVVPDKSAHWAAATFIRQWVTRYGVPKQLICDNDKAFTSVIMKELLDLLGTKLVTTTPYHPEGNGPVESFHRHLRKHYERIRGESMRGEEESLALAMFLYRTAHHTTLGMTPGRWLFGVEPTIPEERELVGTLRNPNLQRIEWLAKTREGTIERMQAEAQQRADRRNERRRGGHLEKGDIVLVRDPTVHERGWGFPRRVVKVSKAGHGAHVEDIVTGHREHRHAGVLRRVTAPLDEHQLGKWVEEYRRGGIQIDRDDLQRKLGQRPEYYELSSDNEEEPGGQTTTERNNSEEPSTPEVPTTEELTPILGSTRRKRRRREE
ncbi:integrase core domain protein [Gregarina niphandrodes]|uniref:Integrase core domain protein n=2 Tax=Gregarina niphandrodes TaxID=110365 RepID=A0A023AW75_GRENI|nr:integrase core domain protein [Gregarina niphandrodes]EZG42964.1 integrase core domain protein [Gregarina niphandrodes]|eukprot:XP_011133764.1 integrase core domain protein [Gregarina niphandrodes]